jgi:transposase
MTELFWLSDKQWAALEPHLPSGRPGVRPQRNRQVLSGIVHVLRTGCRWRDCPAAYGPPTTIYDRFNRWSKRGIWQGLLDRLIRHDATEVQGIDSDALRHFLAERGSIAVIQPNPRRKNIPDFDQNRYKERNRIERAFSHIKDWRRVATRYDKLARYFGAAIAIAAALIWWC